MIATPLIICLSVWSQAAPDAGWLVGEPFDRQLASVTSVLFESAPLGERLETLSRVHRLYVWLDRRVDPSRVVDFQLQGRTVEQTLRQLAATLDLGVCVVGNVVYLGPAETAARLGSWSAHWETERKRLPAAWAQTLGKRSKLSWPLLSTPREVLESVAQQAGMKWEQLEQIPHDLMRATELPELSLAEQLMLLLSGFDRTFRCSADGALSNTAW